MDMGEEYLEELKHLVYTPRSSEELHEKFPYMKIVDYINICSGKYTDIWQLLKPYNRVLVLFNTTDQNYGHWCCLLLTGKKPTIGSNIAQGDTLTWFDSYGINKFPERGGKFSHFNGIVDSEFQWMNKNFRKKFGLKPVLHKLMMQWPKKLDYNDFRLQSTNPNVSTCGLHCVNRMRYSHLTSDEYGTLFKTIPESEGIPSDIVVCMKFLD